MILPNTFSFYAYDWCLVLDCLDSRKSKILSTSLKFFFMSHNVWKSPKNVSFEFFTNFCPIKIDLSGNTIFQKFLNWPFLSILRNVNVARFARNVEWDLLCDFQTACSHLEPLEHFVLVKKANKSRNTIFLSKTINPMHFLLKSSDLQRWKLYKKLKVKRWKGYH